MSQRIYYTKPSITELEIEYANDAARNGWGDRCYEYIARFEDAFKKHLGVNYAIATSSCTGALQMGMAALSIGPGDEVIMADTNWIASASPIVHLGAKPVFVDIDAESWCLNPEQVEAAITPNTKAILAVHIYGNLCDMKSLLAIGAKHGIPVIEDAAEAIGSQYHGKRAGSMGAFGSFSFHGTKTITTGEGGMFVTNDSNLYEKVLMLSNHGRSKMQEKQFWAESIGYKYKMSNIQAAIGCAQIERIQELITRKRDILNSYRNELIRNLDVKINPDGLGLVNGAWMPTIVFGKNTGVRREEIIKAFKDEDIDARVFFWPLTSLGLFEQLPDIRWNSHDISERAINLPSFHQITEEQIKRVVGVVTRLLKH